MNFRKYEFQTWTELNDFISVNKAQLIGRKIDEYYCYGGCMNMGSAEPIVLVIGNLCVCLDYLFLSSITIHTFSKETFKSDISLNFLYKDTCCSRNLRFAIMLDEEFPLYDFRIEDISVDKFSHKFEINSSTGETRPEGGDYFSVIKFHMENEKKLCICAADAICDGWVDAWIE